MNIIGQKKLLSDIDHLILNDNFPRFSILQGAFGSGKKLISSYIAKGLDALLVPCELGVDAVREVIDMSYEQTSPIVYMWADAQKMSPGAKNAILKVTEEPPQNAYFIMTTDNVKGLLGTLLSRGTLFNLNPYTPDELREYIKQKLPDVSKADMDIIVNISVTPKDVVELSNIDIKQLNKVVGILCDNIGLTNLGNELKVSTFLRYKEEDVDKFDPILFMRACMFRYLELMKKHHNSMYSELIRITSQYLSDLTSKSLNKVATVDNWIIDMHLIGEKEDA